VFGGGWGGGGGVVFCFLVVWVGCLFCGGFGFGVGGGGCVWAV